MCRFLPDLDEEGGTGAARISYIHLVVIYSLSVDASAAGVKGSA